MSEDSDEQLYDGAHDEGDEEVLIIYEDILLHKNNKKFKARWSILMDGILVLKGKKQNVDAKIVIDLNGSQVNVTEGDGKRNYQFVIETHSQESFIFATDDQDKLNTWIESINQCKENAATYSITKKQGKLMRMKKSVGGKVATSAAGKKIIRDFIGKDGVKMINILKKAITVAESKEKAKEVENDIIRYGVKAILLFRNKDLKQEEIKLILPRVKKLWQVSQDYCQLIHFDYNSEQMISLGRIVYDLVRPLMQPHLSEKNLNSLDVLFGTLFSEQVLDTLYLSTEMTQDRIKFGRLLEQNYRF